MFSTLVSGIVALFSICDFFIDLGKRARQHEALARSFTGLAAKLETWEPVPSNLKKARHERIKIEARDGSTISDGAMSGISA